MLLDSNKQTDLTAEAAKPYQQEMSTKRNISRHHLHKGKKILYAIATSVLLLGGLACWRLLVAQQSKDVNPFNAKVMASVQFSLFYPKSLPNGYRIDVNSVTEPQSGVVVFKIINKNQHPIYVSEEVRPTSFNFGGYYNDFTDRIMKITNQGTVAVGRINNGNTEIGSIAINKTWVLTNTNAKLPLPQLVKLLQSLTISY